MVPTVSIQTSVALCTGGYGCNMLRASVSIVRQRWIATPFQQSIVFSLPAETAFTVKPWYAFLQVNLVRVT